MEKSPLFIGVVSPLNGHVGIGLARGKEHTRQRRAMAPSMSRNALQAQEKIIQTHALKLVEALRRTSQEGQVVDMGAWCKAILNTPTSPDTRLTCS